MSVHMVGSRSKGQASCPLPPIATVGQYDAIKGGHRLLQRGCIMVPIKAFVKDPCCLASKKNGSTSLVQASEVQGVLLPGSLTRRVTLWIQL